MIYHVETLSNVPEPVVDGVHRLPPTGISILIVGAGLGGLMTACEAWRQGHDVCVLEQTSGMSQLGDTFGILPPALTTFRFFPTMHKDFEACGYDARLSMWDHTGELVVPHINAPWNRPGLSHKAKGIFAAWIEKRSSVVAAVESQVRRLGILLKYGTKVVSYNEDASKGFVRTEYGDVYYADLVVAADGVGTKSHHHVTGKKLPAVSSGYAVLRGIIPADALRMVSEEAKKKYLSLQRPEFRIYMA